MDVSNRLDKAEQRISDLKGRSEEITPNAAQKDKGRQNIKERPRCIAGRTRGFKVLFSCRRIERMGEWQYLIFQN